VQTVAKGTARARSFRDSLQPGAVIFGAWKMTAMLRKAMLEIAYAVNQREQEIFEIAGLASKAVWQTAVVATVPKAASIHVRSISLYEFNYAQRVCR
jgi:hypothetical protein